MSWRHSWHCCGMSSSQQCCFGSPSPPREPSFLLLMQGNRLFAQWRQLRCPSWMRPPQPCSVLRYGVSQQCWPWLSCLACMDRGSQIALKTHLRAVQCQLAAVLEQLLRKVSHPSSHSAGMSLVDGKSQEGIVNQEPAPFPSIFSSSIQWCLREFPPLPLCSC